MNKSSIVIIVGGSFQGKSLISLKCASSLNYSGVLSSDVIRNILRITNPHLSGIYGTSTYLLPKEKLNAQSRDVSSITKELIQIYESRGEHMIFEGMHFDEEYFKWLKENNYCCICLNNLLELDKRLVLKSRTRSLFRFANSSSNEFEFNSINEINVEKSAYMNYAERINEIHNNILRYCEKYNFNIVEYKDINRAIEDTKLIIKTYNKQINWTP